jgi:hypothetical protein
LQLASRGTTEEDRLPQNSRRLKPDIIEGDALEIQP